MTKQGLNGEDSRVPQVTSSQRRMLLARLTRDRQESTIDQEWCILKDKDEAQDQERSLGDGNEDTPLKNTSQNSGGRKLGRGKLSSFMSSSCWVKNQSNLRSLKRSSNGSSLPPAARGMLFRDWRDATALVRLTNDEALA
eukprot:CAMPEP_0175231252 /NCGR_PEP_ID=MMETSP0093-20121207/25362_1 /TAXON_ID=311494 /ORGANISM="Alexandrium monilatum, Strain CCMP3105" /LENGTH=139 /DNA_ID=CAMNT_0016525101 /DNA_START=84 /DNA_END=505 /DNA_ORIENTATION=-